MQYHVNSAINANLSCDPEESNATQVPEEEQTQSEVYQCELPSDFKLEFIYRFIAITLTPPE